MSTGDQDKTEQPTQSRLEEARRKGEVAKSTDLTGFLLLTTFTVTLMLCASLATSELGLATQRTLALAGAKPQLNSALVPWLGYAYGGFFRALSPMVLALIVMGVLANLGQTGPIFSTFALKPSFQRMHPMNAVKRLFSMRGLWELGKLLAKLLMLGLVGYIAVGYAVPFVAKSGQIAVGDLPVLLKSAFWRTALVVLAVLAIVAIADLFFVRRDHHKRMKMSRREVRDDHKRRDGDPEVKSKQRKQIRELLGKVRSLPRVAEADVIITNPTHYAVAVHYRPQTMRSPVVLSKGRGFLAARIRKVASRANVPLVRSPALARALYSKCAIDAIVPEELYGELAPIYRALYAQRKNGVGV